MKYEFRAKTIKDEKWIYGYLISKDMVAGRDGAQVVDPASVGLYINKKDVNGVKIFENDIVKDGSNYFKVKFINCGFALEDISSKNIVNISSDNLEVIGNDYEKESC